MVDRVLPLLIVVPARGGSKRLQFKNIRPLAGRSLLAHTASAIREAGLDVPVLLSTDDEAIAAEGERLGWRVPFRRPAALSGDRARTVDAVLHALDWIEAESGADPTNVLVLQPTSPLRGGACLRQATELLDARPDADAVIGMMALRVPASYLFVEDGQGLASRLHGEAVAPVLAPNGALYLARTAAVRAARSLYTPRLLPLVMDDTSSLDIDTEADWNLAEAVLAAGSLATISPDAARPR